MIIKTFSNSPYRLHQTFDPAGSPRPSRNWDGLPSSWSAGFMQITPIQFLMKMNGAYFGKGE